MKSRIRELSISMIHVGSVHNINFHNILKFMNLTLLRISRKLKPCECHQICSNCIFFMFQMFEGNLNDNTPVRNDFDYAIVARYIRFNPQRWHRYISMRVEAYGCRFGRSELL